MEDSAGLGEKSRNLVTLEQDLLASVLPSFGSFHPMGSCHGL